jgi:hypothetical protein
MCFFFFFNPGPVWRVPIPNRYTAKSKLCFCKNNKRRIIIANTFVLGPVVINTQTPPCVKVPGSSRVPAPPWVGSRSPDGWDQIPRWAGLHQPPWSFGFDSQTRGTRENRAPPCVKVPGSSRSHSPHANSFIKGTAVINTQKVKNAGPGGGGGHLCIRIQRYYRGTQGVCRSLVEPGRVTQD